MLSLRRRTGNDLGLPPLRPKARGRYRLSMSSDLINLRAIRLSVLEHTKTDVDELTHRRAQRTHLGFAAAEQAFIERTHIRVVTDRGDRGHVQSGTHARIARLGQTGSASLLPD